MQAAAKEIKYIILILCLYIFGAAPSLAENLSKYSDSEISQIANQMANKLSAETPKRIDSTTVLLGTIYLSQTKTFTYRYESSVPLDQTKGKVQAARSNCANQTLRAFMARGIVFRHAYLTPAGAQNFDVRISDC